MLKDLFAKMRSGDKWPEVQATVRIVNQYEELAVERYDVSRKVAEVTFAFTDSRGEHQYGAILVADSSSLYDAKEDDTFSIRVNPANPDEYDSPDAIKPRL
ncbi:MAG: hypothetical protein ABSF28_03035 [Terracidiphilus sp.]|jgi:hypothetical protein